MKVADASIVVSLITMGGTIVNTRINRSIKRDSQQLQRNGGSSVSDVVHRLEKKVDALDVRAQSVGERIARLEAKVE